MDGRSREPPGIPVVMSSFRWEEGGKLFVLFGCSPQLVLNIRIDLNFPFKQFTFILLFIWINKKIGRDSQWELYDWVRQEF